METQLAFPLDAAAHGPSETPGTAASAPAADEGPPPIQSDRLWSGQGWTAKVVKNEDDDGWAVAMTREGEREPALVGPWTMGRDKKNPKPLDTPAFHTLVKTANEVVRRHEQALHATLHKEVDVRLEDIRLRICLDIVPDEFEPYARLSARDQSGEPVAEVKVRPDFRLNAASAAAWIDSGFRRP